MSSNLKSLMTHIQTDSHLYHYSSGAKKKLFWPLLAHSSDTVLNNILTGICRMPLPELFNVVVLFYA